jgi:sterol desaturase/sphingolipid hydroxylase (fatty acid hydroxylase superfamily)
MSPQVQAFALQVLRLVIWLGILAAIFAPLERLFTLRRIQDRWRDVPADIGFYFMNSLLPLAVLTPPLALLAVAIHAVTPAGYLAVVGGLPIWAKLGAALVVGEIGGYWGHRLCHEVPLLWRFHVLHHAPEHIDWLVSSRAHPVDQVLEKLFALTPLYILGLAQPTPQGLGLAAYVAIFGTIWGFFVHANVRWRLGPLEWLVSTPAFHHWHHTNDEHRDHNYAALFPWVDRLFGTHHLPDRWPAAYGVDAQQPATMAEQLLRPVGLGARASPKTDAA